MKGAVGYALAIAVTGGCLFACEVRPSPDPSLSFVRVIGRRPIPGGDGSKWENDPSPTPRLLSVRLGAKEFAEARKLHDDLDTSLSEYIAPELKRIGFCPMGYTIEPGNRAGTKRGDYGFTVQCNW